MWNQTAHVLLINLLEARYAGSEDVGVQSLVAFLKQRGWSVGYASLVPQDEEAFCRLLTREHPMFLGFNPHANTIADTDRLARRAKDMILNCFICVGGNYASCLGKDIFNVCTNIDGVVLGEGELTLDDLLERLKTGGNIAQCEGVLLRHQEMMGPRKCIANLDKLPWPYRDFCRCRGVRVARISASRGCWGTCSFCNAPKFWKRPRWRGRSASNICDEIEHLQRDHGVGMVIFNDASFEDSFSGSDYDRASAFALEMIRRGIEVPFSCYFRAESIRDANVSHLKALRAVGLCSAFIGMESGSAADLRRYRKFATVKDNFRAMRILHSLDINVEIGFIMFNPYSTMHDIVENVTFLRRIGYAWNFETLQSRFEMYPGCDLFGEVQRDGLFLRNETYGYKFRDDDVARVAEMMAGQLKGRLLLLDSALTNWLWALSMMRRLSTARMVLNEIEDIAAGMEHLKKQLAKKYLSYINRCINGSSLDNYGNTPQVACEWQTLSQLIRQFYLQCARKGVSISSVVPDTVLAPAKHFEQIGADEMS